MKSDFVGVTLKIFETNRGGRSTSNPDVQRGNRRSNTHIFVMYNAFSPPKTGFATAQSAQLHGPSLKHIK